MPRRSVSIRDVARLAGVSVTTVSHVLNDVAGARVSQDTRARVQEAASTLGYAPNQMARALRTQRSGIIGMVSDLVVTTPYAGQMVLGAQDAALTRGYALMLVNTGGDPEAERRQIAALLRYQVDGIVYAAMYHRRVVLPEALDDVRLVLLDAVADGDRHPSVIPDEVGGAFRAVQLLLDAGHRRIGFATGLDDIPATRGRLEGYRTALQEAGVAFDPALVAARESETGGGYRASLALLSGPDRPTALFCYNDRMAMGAYHAAAELGLTIPADLSVVGFDDQPIIADGLFPGLTTIVLPHYAMGKWAVTTLLDQLTDDGPEPARVAPHVMHTPVVSRGSVAPPAVAAPPTRRGTQAEPPREDRGAPTRVPPS
jgi:LacI family transcriptional regulator